MPVVQRFEEACGVFDIAAWIKHRVEGSEFATVIVVIDLHAADVDELGATAFRHGEALQRLALTGGKERLSFDVEREGAQ